ncbi:MAG: hypothetical protein ABJK59_04765 [Erythrobacter sp.]|uniref:hypothetical protein n=1 Tax=Erythrobacter sp. TaxID=1042 RepID=UPI003296E84E
MPDRSKSRWAISDSRSAFEHALKERGYYLARGDKRGFVAVDMHYEVYSVPKQVDVRTKQIKERLGDPKELLALDEARDAMAQDIGQNLGRLYNEQAKAAQANKERFERDKTRLVEQQRAERARLMTELRQRQVLEQAQRQEQFRRGLLGLWDRITGEHRRIKEQNQIATLAAQQRDQRERDKLTFEQLEQCRSLQSKAKVRAERLGERAKELQADKQRYLVMRMKEAQERRLERAHEPQRPQPPPEPAQETCEKQRREHIERRKREARSETKDPGRDQNGPSLDR